MTTSPILALFGSLGTGELILIGLVALLLFGSRLPEVMRSLGRGVVEFKKGLKDTQDEIERSGNDEPLPPRSAPDTSVSRTTTSAPASLPAPQTPAGERESRDRFLAGQSDSASTSL